MGDAAITKRYTVRHVNGSMTGPLTKAVLKSLADAGTVVPDDELSVEGSDQWISAWKAKGLFSADKLSSLGIGSTASRGSASPIANQDADAATHAHSDPVATDLQRLASLVSQGLITQEDYDEKKRLLLHLEPSPRSSGRKPSYELDAAPPEPQYWYMLGGDVAGPHSMSVLVGRAAAGIILPSTPIAPSPSGPWTKAKAVSALRGQLRDVEDPTGDTLTTRRTGTALLLVPLCGILISCLLQGLGVGGPAVPVFAAFLLVLLTALLVWWDASLVGISDRSSNGKRQTGPFGWAAGTLLLWAFCYPAYMYWRGRTGARQLLAPAIAVAILFVSAPFITAVVFPPLPSVDSYAVTSTLAKALRESTGSKQLIEAGLVNDNILNPTQVSFDPWGQRRIGRGQIRTALGLETVTFSVSWQSRRRGDIWVEVNPQATNDFARSNSPPEPFTTDALASKPPPALPPPTLQEQFPALRAQIASSSIATVVKVPATGLFARNPQEAEQELMAVGTRLGWVMHDVVLSAVKNGDFPSIERAMYAQVAAGKMDANDISWLTDLLARVGMAAHDQPVPPADLRRVFTTTRSAFESGIDDILKRAASSLEATEASKWRSTLNEELTNWENRCLADPRGGDHFREARDLRWLRSEPERLMQDLMATIAKALTTPDFSVGSRKVRWGAPETTAWAYVENVSGSPHLRTTDAFNLDRKDLPKPMSNVTDYWINEELASVFEQQKPNGRGGSVFGLAMFRLRLSAEVLDRANVAISIPNSEVDLYIPCVLVQGDDGDSAGLRFRGVRDFVVCQVGLGDRIGFFEWHRQFGSDDSTAAAYGRRIASSANWGREYDSTGRSRFVFDSDRSPTAAEDEKRVAAEKLYGILDTLIGTR